MSGHQLGMDFTPAATGRERDASASQLIENVAKGRELRDAGIALTTQANAEFVRFMREEAKYMARQRGEVHIDDVRERAGWYGLKPASPNAWGAIFAERGVWRIIGYRASTVASNHGHVSPVRVLA